MNSNEITAHNQIRINYRPMHMGFFKAQVRKQKMIKTLKPNKKMLSPFLLSQGLIIDPCPISDLPVDLLTLILVRLSVKYVLRCMSVHKSWNLLIKTPTFVTLYANYHNQNNHHRPRYLLFKADYSCWLTIRSDDRQCREYCRTRYHPDLDYSTRVAQSHGLLCITYKYYVNNGKTHGTHLWNPLVQKYKTLPRSPLLAIFPSRLSASAFGFVPQLNDYVVVYLVQPYPTNRPPNPHLAKIDVYSLNENSWKTISQDYVFKGTIEKRNSLLVNGVAFWLGSKLKGRRIIVCFDTKTNTLREILLPDWVEIELSIGIHLFGQSIACFVEDCRSGRLDIWILKGDSINEFFWEKKMSVDISEWLEVLGLRNNGEPIVFNLYDYSLYNLDSHEANDFVKSWNRWGDCFTFERGMTPLSSINPFVETLALLDLDQNN